MNDLGNDSIWESFEIDQDQFGSLQICQKNLQKSNFQFWVIVKSKRIKNTTEYKL